MFDLFLSVFPYSSSTCFFAFWKNERQTQGKETTIKKNYIKIKSLTISTLFHFLFLNDVVNKYRKRLGSLFLLLRFVSNKDVAKVFI